jgi:hypothetical protein
LRFLDILAITKKTNKYD